MAIRRHFVIKLIPMLNPDGVAHGYYRTDTRGINLNRVYSDPHPKLHPSIFAARSVMLHYHKKSEEHSSVVKKHVFSRCTCHAKASKQRRGGSAKANTTTSHSSGRRRSQTYPVDNTYVNEQSLKKMCMCQASRQCSPLVKSNNKV